MYIDIFIQYSSISDYANLLSLFLFLKIAVSAYLVAVSDVYSAAPLPANSIPCFLLSGLPAFSERSPTILGWLA